MTTTLRGVDRDLLRRRAQQARSGLAACRLCERRCGVDRLAGEPAPCGLGAETWCFKRHLSFAEEPALVPSYMVYLGACNFRCRFCVQGPLCFAPRHGTLMRPDEAAADFTRAVAAGARTINLLGGEPSLHAHTILEIAAAADGTLPLVLNSNMYMTPEVIDLLDGAVTMYLADFKFGNDRCARRLAGVDRYLEVVTRNILHAERRGEIIIRHLLMPGHRDCCYRPVAEWVAAHLPHVPFNVMTGFVPPGRAAMVSRNAGDDRDPLGRDLEVTIRVGPDGRVYFNDLTADLLPVAS
ncbi:MAG: radical SAM protein, partial [Planctomycetota bacterium]